MGKSDGRRSAKPARDKNHAKITGGPFFPYSVSLIPAVPNLFWHQEPGR